MTQAGFGFVVFFTVGLGFGVADVAEGDGWALVGLGVGLSGVAEG